MDIRHLKHELVETLDGIDKDEMDLCSLKEYAEIVKVVSEIRERDALEVFGDMFSSPSSSAAIGYGMMSGPRTVRELREARKVREGDDD